MSDLLITYTPRHARQAAKVLDRLVRIDRKRLALVCEHHHHALTGWRSRIRHEDADDFAERVAEYVRQCCGWRR